MVGKRYKSINTRVAVVMGIGFSLAFLLYFLVNVVTYTSFVNSEHHSEALEYMRHFAQESETTLSEYTTTLQAINNNIKSTDEEYLSNYLQTYINSLEHVTGGYIIIPSSQQQNMVASGTNDVFMFFVENKVENYAGEMLFSPKSAMGTELTKRCLESGKIVVSPPFYYPKSLGYGAQFALIMPLSVNAGGVIALNFDASSIIPQSKGINTPGYFTAYIVNEREIIYSQINSSNNLIGRHISEAYSDSSIAVEVNVLNKESIEQKDGHMQISIQLSTESIDNHLFLFAWVNPLNLKALNTYQRQMLWLTIAIILLSFVLIYVYSRSIAAPIVDTLKYARRVAAGNVQQRIADNNVGLDEAGKINITLNQIIDTNRKIIEVCNKVGQLDYHCYIEPNGESDMVSHAINNMLNKLADKEKQEQTQKEKNERASWVREKGSQFTEIMRQYTGNFDTLTSQIVKNIVSILGANQAGLFILNDTETEPHLELAASFAYNHEKYHKKIVTLNEGLLGAAATEKLTIKLNNLPDEYLQIESGLGLSSPRHLLIVPLKFEDTVMGVIEVASFFNFDEYQVQFTERAAEVIASSLSIANINNRNEKLLAQTREQAQELFSSEKRLRENMSKIQLTQRQAQKQEAEIRGILNAVKSVLAVAEYSPNGKLLDMNMRMAEMFQVDKSGMEGKYHRELTNMSKNPEKYAAFWDDLQKGIPKFKPGHVLLKDGSEIWLEENFQPVQDDAGNVIKVLNIIIDKTEATLLQLKLDDLLSE